MATEKELFELDRKLYAELFTVEFTRTDYTRICEYKKKVLSGELTISNYKTYVTRIMGRRFELSKAERLGEG